MLTHTHTHSNMSIKLVNAKSASITKEKVIFGYVKSNYLSFSFT